MTDGDSGLNFEPTNETKDLQQLIDTSPHLRELEVAADGLKGPSAPRQRLYLLCYVRSMYDPRAARAMYEQTLGERLPSELVRAWKKKPAFRRALELCESAVYKTLGITPASVLAMTREAADRCMREVPVLDSDGNPTGRTQWDASGAARFIELLGKHLKVWKDDDRGTTEKEGPALVINIQSHREPAIEAPDQKTVNINLPRPDRGS
jgi:hypothetical protein